MSTGIQQAFDAFVVGALGGLAILTPFAVAYAKAWLQVHSSVQSLQKQANAHAQAIQELQRGNTNPADTFGGTTHN